LMVQLRLPKEDAAEALEQQLRDEIAGVGCGISWPWPALDRLFGGLRQGDWTVLSGTEGSAKSFFMLQLCLHCQRQGIAWKYLPLEEDARFWLRRMVAILANDWKITERSQSSAQARLDAWNTHKPEILELKNNILENPRLAIESNMVREDGTPVPKVVPRLPYEEVLQSMQQVMPFCDLLVIDPVTLIDFKIRRYDDGIPLRCQRFDGEEEFVRDFEGYVASYNCHVVVVTHTTKDGALVQGSGDWTRFSQNSMKLIRHDPTDSTVIRPNQYTKRPEEVDIEDHLRTLQLHKTRNGPGSGMHIAYDYSERGPSVEEHGVIKKAKKKGGK